MLSELGVMLVLTALVSRAFSCERFSLNLKQKLTGSPPLYQSRKHHQAKLRSVSDQICAVYLVTEIVRGRCTELPDLWRQKQEKQN